MLGSGWGGVKPYPDARQVSSDGIRAPVAGKSYCARVRARADRDAGLQEVYGEYTYLADETGTSFTWVGPPTAERARRRVSPGTSARTTISSRQRASRRRACRSSRGIRWRGRQATS